MQIKLDLHIETVNAALTGLGKLPFEYSAQHITVIQQQAAPQVQAAEQEAKAKEAQLSLPLDQPND
jgi:hypothetical protein